MNTLVVDTNILIAALIRQGLIREILTNFNISFVFPENGLREIYKHKEDIKSKANISEKEFDILLLRILKYVKLIPLEMIEKYKSTADNIMKDIDKDDSIFIATALAFNCPVWSDDPHLKKQNEVKVFTTKDMVYFI